MYYRIIRKLIYSILLYLCSLFFLIEAGLCYCGRWRWRSIEMSDEHMYVFVGEPQSHRPKGSDMRTVNIRDINDNLVPPKFVAPELRVLLLLSSVPLMNDDLLLKITSTVDWPKTGSWFQKEGYKRDCFATKKWRPGSINPLSFGAFLRVIIYCQIIKW